MLITDNQQKIENENKFKVLKRELNVTNQNNILSVKLDLKDTQNNRCKITIT